MVVAGPQGLGSGGTKGLGRKVGWLENQGVTVGGGAGCRRWRGGRQLQQQDLLPPCTPHLHPCLLQSTQWAGKHCVCLWCVCVWCVWCVVCVVCVCVVCVFVCGVCVCLCVLEFVNLCVFLSVNGCEWCVKMSL